MNTSWAIDYYLLTEFHVALAGFRNDLPIAALSVGVYYLGNIHFRLGIFFIIC
jgi:hypothetical protein